MNISHLEEFGDSMLVVNQIKGTYEAKEMHIQKYMAQTQTWIAKFQTFEITLVPRSKKKEADALSKIASIAFRNLSKTVLVEVLPKKHR